MLPKVTERPKLIVNVKVSNLPGSLIVPVNLATPCSSTPDTGLTTIVGVILCTVTVVLSLTNGNKILTVHKDAIIKRANGNIVFVVKGMNATMRNVKLGRGVGNKFQVLEGLKAGDKVVVRGNERLGAGGRIKMAE